MSVYSYPQSKTIDEVIFHKSEGGHTRAYLHADASASSETLRDIICKLADQGWQVTPYSASNKPLLEVHGFSDSKQLLQYLGQQKWTDGPTYVAVEKEEKNSVLEQIKKRSLGASGLAYVVGDASFAAYGYKDNNHLNLAAGLLYGGGTASLLLGGRKDPSDLQIKDVARKMATHFRDIDIPIPDDCALNSITNHESSKGIVARVDEYIRRYPSEAMNLFFAAAGACIAIAAHKSLSDTIKPHEIEEVFVRQKDKLVKKHPTLSMDALKSMVADKMHINHKRESWLDIGLGTMTGVSGLFAMSVKEKASDPDEAPKQGLARAWEYVQHKPLAIAGIGYMASTLCHAVSTTIAWNYASTERRKSVPFRALFVAANLMAETLLAISSKGHGEGVKAGKSVDNTVISLAAEQIVSQPKALQEYLIRHMAGFLGRSDVLAMKNDEAVDRLRTQVEAMRENPWALSAKERRSETLTQEPDPAMVRWRSKLAEERAPNTHLSV